MVPVIPTFTVRIQKSIPSDIPLLAPVLAASHVSETIMSFFFPDWPSTETIVQYMTARLEGKMAEPNSEIYKAVDESTGQILGMVIMTLQDSKEAPERKLANPGGGFKVPTGFNYAFAGDLIEGLKKLDGVMARKKHYSK
jgi:hypothetical protein